MKVLHLPTSVGGNSWALAQGEKRLGLDSRVLVKSQSTLGYPTDINLNLQHRTPVGKLARLLRVFLAIRKQFDVFHFNFGSSLIHAPTRGLNQADLPYYPRRARLFATYNGCDARQKFPTMARSCVAACHDSKCYGGQCNSGRLDAARRRGIEKMSRYVEHIWALNPDLLHFLPPEKSSFLPYVCAVDSVEPPMPVGEKKTLRVVHAPTDRAAKGTDHILRAVGAIEKRYPGAIELRLVEGLPYEQALRVYQTADLVIDQVLIGWYGGLAVEVMKMGKPVIARINEADLRFLPTQMARDVQQAVIAADPTTLEHRLARCIEDRTWLRARADAAVEYVHRWHAPEYVAALTKSAYEGASSIERKAA